MIQNNILVSNNNSDSNSLRFFSSLCETNSILQPSWGTGPATFSRASAQYITDFEGETRKVESGCVAVEGSRVVTNLLTYSEDLSNAAWVVGGGAGKATGNVLNVPSELSYVYHSAPAIVPVNTVLTLSATLSGSGTISLRVSLGTSEFIKRVTLSATPTRFSQTITVAVVPIITVAFIYRNTGDTATSVTVHSAQLENVTRQTNQNPGEYVRTTSSALSQCFSTTNGNTVDANGVVTEATGTSLPQAYPERANSTAYALGQRIQVSGWWYNCTTAGTSAGSAPTFPQGYAGSQTVTDGTAVWTIGGRLLLGYVSEPASTNKVTAYGIIPAATLGSELSSGSLTIGQVYQITARTDANFIADGAANNNVGTQFVATAATVTLDAGNKVKRVQWGVGEKSFHNGSSFVQNITGLTLSGDVAGVLSIISGTTLTTNAGLLTISPIGKLYQVDNTTGSAVSIVTVAGTAGNTNKHSGSIYIAKISGSGTSTIEINGTTTTITGATLQRLKVENVTPASGSQFVINTGIGDKVQFCLMGYEESVFATSIIPSAGATATRAATSLSYPTAGNLRGNDVTVGIEATPYTLSSDFVAMFYSYNSADIYLAGYLALNKPVFNKRITTSYYASFGATVTANSTFKFIGKLSSATGVSMFISGTKGPNLSTNTLPATIGNSLTIGTDGANATYSMPFKGYLRNFKIWFKPLSDDRCKQLTL